MLEISYSAYVSGCDGFRFGITHNPPLDPPLKKVGAAKLKFSPTDANQPLEMYYHPITDSDIVIEDREFDALISNAMALCLPVVIQDGCCYSDGEFISMSFRDAGRVVEYKWGCELPEDWRPLNYFHEFFMTLARQKGYR